MLVLSRKIGQRIVIGDNITIIVNRIAGNRVSIGIEAPEEVHIIRGELQKLLKENGALAIQPDTGGDGPGVDVAPEATPTQT